MDALFDDGTDHIVLVDVAPEMDVHSLFAIEQRMRYTADLAQDDMGDWPCVGVLLESAYVEADGLFNDVVLTVRDKEGPVREVHD